MRSQDPKVQTSFLLKRSWIKRRTSVQTRLSFWQRGQSM